MSKFSVGDKVMIAPSSGYYVDGNSSNPKDLEGVVTDVDGCLFVDWDNGEQNSYDDEDLVSVESTGIESILERYAAIKSSDDMVQEARGSAYGDMVQHVDKLLAKSPESDRESLEWLFNEREEQYMEKHHSGDEAYQKMNGSWNMSTVFDGAYKSAKSTVLGAVGVGVTLLQEDGSPKGKSALAKETKEATPVPDISRISSAMATAVALAVEYSNISDPIEREQVRDYLSVTIMEN